MEIAVEKSIGWLHLMKAHPGKSGARMTVFLSEKEILKLELGMYVYEQSKNSSSHKYEMQRYKLDWN